VRGGTAPTKKTLECHGVKRIPSPLTPLPSGERGTEPLPASTPPSSGPGSDHVPRNAPCGIGIGQGHSPSKFCRKFRSEGRFVDNLRNAIPERFRQRESVFDREGFEVVGL